MVETDYFLHPLGRKIMLGLLGLSFILFFILAPYIIYPINLLLSQFISFQLVAGIFVRGVLGVLFSIILTAALLEVIFEKIGWYYLEFDEDRYLTLHYRSKLFGGMHSLEFNLRETKIGYVDRLMWIVSADPKNRYSILLLPPVEKVDDETFYHAFDKQVDENYYKAKKRVDPLSLEDYDFHYLFSQGKLKRLNPRQFQLLTGVLSFYDEEATSTTPVSEDQDVEYIEEEEDLDLRADYYEYEQIMNDAEIVYKIE